MRRLAVGRARPRDHPRAVKAALPWAQRAYAFDKLRSEGRVEFEDSLLSRDVCSRMYSLFKFSRSPQELRDLNQPKGQEEVLGELYKLLARVGPKIVVNVGLSGAGKTRLLYDIARRNAHDVLLYDWSRAYPRLILAAGADDPTSFEESIDNAQKLHRQMQALTSATAHALHRLIELADQQGGEQVEPLLFLRYLEDGGGGQTQISRATRKLICSELDLQQLMDIKRRAIESVRAKTNRRIVEAWDEAGLLASTAADRVPLLTGAGASKPEELDPTIGQFKQAGSAFTIANRIALASPDGVQSIFCGTTLDLHRARDDISKDMQHRVELIAERHHQILRPWSRHEALANLDEDLTLDRSKVGANTLDVVSYFLQGRPRLTTLFKGELYGIKERLIAAKAPQPSHEELLLLALAQTKAVAIHQALAPQVARDRSNR